MRSIDGRNSDIIVTPNGNRLIVHFFTGIFEYATTIDTFQVIQETPEEILCKIVPLSGFKMQDWHHIKDEIIKKGDPDLKVHMEIVSEISPDKSNKRRFVISRLN